MPIMRKGRHRDLRLKGCPLEIWLPGQFDESNRRLRNQRAGILDTRGSQC